ncbi:acyltransferase family protein [Fibrobacter sp.]|uniref:acyltransferase family protein n=1 Tax=Fibrobacter sp. TaxID=35828 RepID=UPI00388D48E3
MLIKGLAIMMMLAHHLFAFPERIPDIEICGVLVNLGHACKICVNMFIFISGYGLTVSYRDRGFSWRDFKGRVGKLYLAFWKYFVPFFVVANVFGFYKFDAVYALTDILCISQEFYHESWFILTYFLCLLIFPLFLKIKSVYAFLGVTVVLTVIVRVLLSFLTIDDFLLVDVSAFGLYFSSFLLGMLAAKTKNKIALNKKAFAVSLFVAVALLYARAVSGMNWITIVVTPFIVFLCCYLAKLKITTKALCFLGSRSMGIWLVHCYFLYYFCKPLLFGVTSSPALLYGLLLLYSLVFMFVIDWSVDKISKRVGL